MSKTQASEVKTTFSKRNPLTGERVGIIDPTKLELTDDPPPSVRATKDGKYTQLFIKAVATGKRIKCESNQAAKIATSLKKFMKDRSIPGGVQSTSNYHEDGKGGVWYIKKKGASN